MALRILDRHDSKVEHNDLDLPGAVLVTGGLSLLVYALVDANNRGWGSTRTIGLLAVSAALLFAFVIIERRAPAPLVPFSIFRMRTLTGATGRHTLAWRVVIPA